MRLVVEIIGGIVLLEILLVAFLLRNIQAIFFTLLFLLPLYCTLRTILIEDEEDSLFEIKKRDFAPFLVNISKNIYSLDNLRKIGR